MSAAPAYVCRQFVEDVTAYLDGAVSDDLAVLIEAHLADCPHCREYLRQIRETITVERAVTEHDVDAMPADVHDRLLQAFRDRPE